MSISEKANDLLNKFGGAQYDYVVWSTQDNLVARDKARQEISDHIAELEALVDELVDIGDNLLYSLDPIEWKHEWLDKWWKLSNRIRKEREE